MEFNLKTVKQFVAETGVFTVGQINGWIADDSTGFRKEVVRKAGRKTLIDVDAFPGWFEKFSDKNKSEQEKKRKERAAARAASDGTNKSAAKAVKPQAVAKAVAPTPAA